MPRLTYTLHDGTVLELSGLDEEQRLYLDAAFAAAWPAIQDGDHAASRALMDWPDFHNEILSSARNPLLRETHGFVTRAIWEHPLYRAVRDLDARLGMRQGQLKRPRGKRWLADPFADEFLPVSEVARRKKVSVMGVHKAIKRGDLITTTGMLEAGRGGQRSGRLVSQRSAAAWTPKRAAQAS